MEIVFTIVSFKSSNWWAYFVDSINIIIGILTLLIALKIFYRFSFKNKVLDKQFETVSELVNILQHFTVSIHSKGHNEPKENYFSLGWRVKFFDFKNLKESENHKELFFDEKLLFTQAWFEQNPLIGLDNNPFMPKAIANKIEKFRIWLPTKANLDLYDKVTYIDLDQFDPNFKRGEKNTQFICNPNEPCFENFETFYIMCKDLVEEVEKWLKKYDADYLNLK